MKPDYIIPNIMIMTFFTLYKEKISFIHLSFKPFLNWSETE